LIFGLVSIAFSFLCSILEAVLLSIPPSYVHVAQQEGSATGKLLQEFKEEVDEPLTAILSLNTVAHTVGAIGVGASTGAAFGEGHLELLGAHISYEVIVSIVMTLAILILSEIIPKTLGATYWRQLAPFTARTLKILTNLFRWTGLLWLSKQITSLFKGKNVHGSTFNRTDFTAMAEIGTESGVFAENEGRILQNLMALESLKVKDVMTPRTVVQAIPAHLTIGEFYEKYQESPFSRFPIYNENRDDITGYVLRDDVLKSMIKEDTTSSINSLRRDLLMVGAGTTLHDLIDQLLARREQIALVIDEYGGLEGLVTMEDAVETLLGMEIVDEKDSTVDMVELARQRWAKRAKAMGMDLETLQKLGNIS
ncbi:MAG: hemolysin family protein, partial [Bacteroidota bacterium]